MNITQIDIFGGEHEHEDSRLRKTPTMQEMYGVIEGKQCRTCKHLYYYRQSAKWYKCELWDAFFRGHSAASDIRLKNQACGKYEEDI